jgi:hypothetical protein
MTVTVVLDLALLYLVGTNVLAILVYVLVLKRRARRLANDIRSISSVIADYFRADGIEVRVDCVASPNGKGFIAFIESEPMKRFRYSYIVEATLHIHVHRMCGLELERIFWRFPIQGNLQKAEEAVREMEKHDDERDDYIREGLEYLKKKEGYDIREGSWEEFENTVNHEEAGSQKTGV